MAKKTSPFRLGPYTLGMEPNGIRLSRDDAPTPGGAHALLRFSLAREGGQSIPFLSQNLYPAGGGKAEYGAMATDREALNLEITYREDFDGFDIALILLNATEEMTMRLSVSLELLGEADPRWLIPGLFYGDNRDRDCPRIYPAYSEVRRDTRRFLSNHWMFRSDRTAMPVAFCTTFGVCAFLATEETPGITETAPLGLGTTGIGFTTEDGHPVLEACLPYIEEPVKYSYCRPDRTAPVETFVRIPENTPLRTTYRLAMTPITDGGFGCAWDAPYRVLHREFAARSPQRPRVSPAEAERLAVRSLMQWHVDEKKAMISETSAFDKHFGRAGTNTERFHMHAGWMSGALPATVLLWKGREAKDAQLVRVATDVLNLLTSQLTPCGTLWPLYTEDEGYCAGYGPEPGLAHSRTVAEAVLFLLRAIRIDLQANTSHPDWFNAARSNIEFILAAQREDGALPSYWRVDDGEPFSYDGAAGICWIPALAAFARIAGDPRCRDAARAAGEYYGEMVENDFLAGCVEDLPLVPTCDDPHFALLAYMALFEMDRTPEWLDAAKRAAALALTFRAAHNIAFHPMSVLGHSRFATRGGDISSVATPSLGVAGLFSYTELVKLTVATGDAYYARRAREARTFATQMIARVDGEYNAREAHALGQVFHTDWWQPKGMVLSMGHAMTAALIGYTELAERHICIPLETKAGLMDMRSQTSVPILSDEIILPDPAEVHRRRAQTDSETGGTPEPDSGVAGDPSALVSHFTSRLADVLGLDDEPPPSRPRESTASIRLPRRGAPPARRDLHEPPPMDAPRVPGIDEKTPVPGMPVRGDEMTPPPVGGPREKTPLETRHTPLAFEAHDTPTRDIRVKDEPGLQKPSTPIPGPGINEPTPAGLGGGILANLFDDSYTPPGSGGKVTDADRPQPPEDDLISDDEAPGPKEQDGEIKWKIF